MTHHPIREHLLQWRANPHVCTECNALLFVLMAIGSALAGLRVAPIACALFAIVFFASDVHDWWREHH